MPEPEPWNDDRGDMDPPPPWSPRLVGDLDGARGLRASSELRASQGPPMSAAEAHSFHRNLVIAIAVKAGMRLKVVGQVFGISESGVCQVCRRLEASARKGHEAP